MKHKVLRGFTDEAAHEDLFEIDYYVKSLSEFILTCNTPMTISIQGTWGAGKTSFMNLVRAYIQNEKVFDIWFNTWQFSQFELGNQLPFSMMSLLMKELDADVSTIYKLTKGVFNFSKKLGVAAIDFATCGAVADSVSNITDAALAKEFDVASELSELKQKFQDAVNKKLEKVGLERLVVFVDDLDRLEPQRAVELLEVLKLFLDCKNCVFILAIDYDVVCRGVAAKYNFDDKDSEKGKSFFDKIIQLPFKMPISNYNIANYIKYCLQSIGTEIKDQDLPVFQSLISNSIGRNPRTMKRLFNSFLLINIMAEGKRNKINPTLLFGILCLQYIDDRLYNYIVLKRDVLSKDILIDLFELKADKVLNDHDFGMDQDTFSDVYSNYSQFFETLIDVIDSNKTDGETISDEEFVAFKEALTLTATTSSTAVTSEEHSAKLNKQKVNRNIIYCLDGVQYAKRIDFVVAVLEKYHNEHPNITTQEFIQAFPDDIQTGGWGVIRDAEIVKKYTVAQRAIYRNEKIKTKDGAVYVSRTWTANSVDSFFLKAKENGMNVESIIKE